MSDLTRRQRKRDPRSVLLTTDGRGVAAKADALDALLGEKDARLARREQACHQLQMKIRKLERALEMERGARVKWERKARGF